MIKSKPTKKVVSFFSPRKKYINVATQHLYMAHRCHFALPKMKIFLLFFKFIFSAAWMPLFSSKLKFLQSKNFQAKKSTWKSIF